MKHFLLFMTVLLTNASWAQSPPEYLKLICAVSSMNSITAEDGQPKSNFTDVATTYPELARNYLALPSRMDLTIKDEKTLKAFPHLVGRRYSVVFLGNSYWRIEAGTVSPTGQFLERKWITGNGRDLTFQEIDPNDTFGFVLNQVKCRQQ